MRVVGTISGVVGACLMPVGYNLLPVDYNSKAVGNSLGAVGNSSMAVGYNLMPVDYKSRAVGVILGAVGDLLMEAADFFGLANDNLLSAACCMMPVDVNFKSAGLLIRLADERPEEEGIYTAQRIVK